jgi:thymidylate synthase
VAQVVHSLRTNPGSRRHIIEGWNVAELDAMALPPCHKSYQLHVSGNRLNGLLYQRSCDLGLGFAFNIWSLGLLIRMLAQQCDLEPGEAVWMGGDVHLYLNHAPLVEEQLSREPAGEAQLAFARRPESIFGYAIEDFIVSGYAPQAHIAAPVAV